jgi:hypothetical protein
VGFLHGFHKIMQHFTDHYGEILSRFDGLLTFPSDGAILRRQPSHYDARKWTFVCLQSIVVLCVAGQTETSPHNMPCRYVGEVKVELYSFLTFWAGMAQSVLRLVTGWKVRGSNPSEGEIFRTSCTKCTGSLSRG